MIGILGGTFNPIHFGHINLALQMYEKFLSEVWFVPALQSPFRSDRLVSSDDRKKMIELAIQDIPNFFLNDIEMNRQPPSYTIDTLKELSKKGYKLALLMGEDTAVRFDEWKEPFEILKLATLLIGCRKGSKLSEKLATKGIHPEIREAIQKGLVETPVYEISGTEVRHRLEKGLYCGHQVPPKTLEYIYKKRIYSKAGP